MIWEKRRLGDIADSCLGKMLDNEKNKGEYQPYLANVNVRWGSFDLENLPQMRFLKAENERYSLEYGDLVICEGGEPGRCAIWKNQLPNMKFQKALHRVRVHEGVDYRFLYYWFLNAGKHGILDQYSTGATIKHIPGDKLQRIMIDLPPQKAQKVIAEMLSVYDETVENNQKRIALLEQIAENLYKEWFVRFRFPGYETAEFENGIPKGWEYKRADEVVEFNPSLKTGNQTEFTIIPMEALSTNSMVMDSSCFVRQDSISGRRSQNGDTLLAKITPCLENGKTGFVMGMPENEVLGGSTEFVVMRSKALTPHYVYCIARSEYFRQTAILSMNGADGRQRVDEDKLKSTKILQPEKAVLARFETIITPIFSSVYQMVQENKNLIRQRDLLLPRLMSGKLEV